MKKCSILTQIAVVFFLLLLPMRLSAQEIKAKGIPHINQLPIHLINTVFQDSEGYIWYGTEDGLCRDDGYDIQIFRSDYLDGVVGSSNGRLNVSPKRDGMLVQSGTSRLFGSRLKSNMINCLAEDSVTHHLWIGTNRGLYVLDKQSYIISAIDKEDLGEREINDIHITSDGSIWGCSPRKIFRIDKDGKVKQFPLQCIPGAGKEYVLYEDRNYQLLLSLSGKGLYKWDRETDEFSLFFSYEDRINGIIQDNTRDYYWLASWDHSIIRLDPGNADEKMRYVFQELPVTVSGLTARTATNIVQDDTFNYIWITSWSDLFVYRIKDNGMLERVDTSGFLPQRNKPLRNIIKDRRGNLWVTALDDNNFFISFDENKMRTYSIRELEERMKWTPAVVSLCRDEKGIFWFFQRRIGLCLYDAGKNKIKRYSDCNEIKDQPFWGISCLLKSRCEDLVWVAGEYQHKIWGLTQHDMEIGISRKIDLSKLSNIDYPGFVIHLFEDKEQNLWIATDVGLFLYETSRQKLEIVSGDCGNVTNMIQTEDGAIWGIQKSKGIVRINPDRKVEMYADRNDILSLTATTDGILWLATDKGEILSFNPQDRTHKDYSIACGMNGSKINDIVADHFDHIWIVSNRGIKEFNPQNGAYRNFDAASENIKFTQFLPHSIYSARDGILYFGGIPGILSISPSTSMEHISQHIKPLITDVKVMGTSLYFNPGRKLKSLDCIDIYPDEQNLEIRFSSLDYQHTEQIRYAYRLSGVDKDWVYLPAGANAALYNKLEKGTYHFEVKATDKNGLWCNHISNLTIRRLPAYYESWWAYILYILLFSTVVYYLYQTVRNRIRLRNQLHLRELEQAKSEEVNHAKLQFFTNITHELLTPLTILSASVEELKQEMPAYKEKYKVMSNNVNRLIRLLQQILEFRKAETGNLKLKVSFNDLALFIQRSVDSFLPLIRKKGMLFEVSCQPNPFMVYFDPDKLDKIIYNLLSNAAKYNVPGGKVCVTLIPHPDKENFFQLTVKDNGPGISREAQKDLFKRFYEGKHRKFNTIGTGIGLSLVNDLVMLHHGSISVASEEGQGAAFIISLPSDKESYTAEELDTDLSFGIGNLPQALPTVGCKEDVRNEEEDQTVFPKPKQAYNLLIVEDNEELLHLMERLLSTEYKVYTASNGKEGMKCVKQQEIHLIVSDVMMPVMDGIEFCRNIKGNIETSHIPVILLTAKKQEEDRMEAYESGADSFIGKPFNLSVLYARIVNLLSAREKATKSFKKQLVFEAKELNYTSLDEEFLKKAIECVHRHLDNPEFNQQQFIDELHTTRSTSFRKLKALTGLNFPTFVTNIRMKAACQIMEEKPRMKISEVAYAVGYNDPRYFTANFKKEIGISPAEYMEKFASK